MKNFKTWFDNFWYHYKWMTIIITISVTALIFCLVQCSSKTKYDMYTLYAGPYYIGGQQSAMLSDAVNDHMDAERQNVCVNSFVYVSEAKKEEYKQNDAYVNDGINMQQTSDFFDFLYTAGFNMLILDSELYSRIEKEEILTPISDISSVATEKQYDTYSIKLHDTSLPDKYAIFAEMPEDTVLCFRKKVLMQSLSSKEEANDYEYQKSVFKKMIEE